MNRLVIGRLIGIALGGLLTGAAASAAAVPDACPAAARAVLASCQAGAQSDYALARGKCLNLPGQLRRGLLSIIGRESGAGDPGRLHGLTT